jgi:thiamine pyrophosphokinase
MPENTGCVKLRLTGSGGRAKVGFVNHKAETTVLLANGAYPVHPFPVNALRSARRIVCCDGAADRLSQAGLEPAWVIGDLDSLSPAARVRWPGRVVAVSDPESNDLTKAFRFCVSRGWRDLVIVGATGLREDHTLGNLSLLPDFAQEAEVLLLTDTGTFRPMLRSARLRAHPGQQVSIFSFDPRTVITSEGLRYPLRRLRLSRWWQATLNEACGDEFDLIFEGGPLLVFQTYEIRPNRAPGGGDEEMAGQHESNSV